MLFRSQQSIIKCTDNRLYGCGYNGHCELGIGYAQDYNDGWTQILLPSDFNPVVVGSVCSTGTTRVYMAIGSDNRAYGWGYNGQYGVIQNFIANNIDVPFQINLPFAG